MLNNSTAITDGSIEDCFETYIVVKPSRSYVINSIIGCIVNGVFALSGVLLNSLVIYVFWKTPKLRLKVSYFMLMVLSSMDFCASAIVHPLHVLNSIAEIAGSAKCSYKMVYQTSAVMLSGVSFLTFFVMNVERFISIVHPFFHLSYVTKPRCFFASSLTWVICTVTGIAPFFSLDIQNFVTALSLTVVSGTFYIYVRIFMVARKRNPRDRETSVRSDELDNDLDHDGRIGIQSRKAVSFLHDLQLAKMYLIVVLASLVLNLPNAIVLGMFPERIETLNNVVQVKIWTITLVAINSTMNCLIFFWANKRLRRESWRLYKRLIRG